MAKTSKTPPTDKSKKNKVKKYITKSFASGRLYVKATFNNTLATVTDPKGNVLTWATSGRVGFKGSKKSTPFAATTAISKVLDDSKKFGIKKLSVFINGPGVGRDAVLRFLRGSKDYEIDQISDITPIPHNGPRPPKQRRV